MRISAVIFDMDGLMLDTEPLYRAAWQQACQESGFHLDDNMYSSFVGRRTRDCEADIVARFGPSFSLSEFKIRWPRMWEASVRHQGIPIKPGLLALLSFLEGRRLPIGVATSSGVASAELSLRSAGLSGRFNVLVTGDQVVHGKPAPDIYLEAARRLKQDPVHCLALEDSDAGVLSACAAGMTTLCVPDLKEPSAEAASAAFRVIRSLEEAPDLISAMLNAAGEGSTGHAISTC
jgi:beta-phosphoglucomutase-like phosphatase (HAD superfamily)